MKLSGFLFALCAALGLRFKCIPCITTRVLSKELKELEANKLIIHQVYTGHPVTIEYTLTTYSYSLTPVIDEMIKWGNSTVRKWLSPCPDVLCIT